MSSSLWYVLSYLIISLFQFKDWEIAAEEDQIPCSKSVSQVHCSLYLEGERFLITLFKSETSQQPEFLSDIEELTITTILSWDLIFENATYK